MSNSLSTLFKRILGAQRPPLANSDASSAHLSGLRAYGPGGLVLVAGTTATLRAASGGIAYRCAIELAEPGNASSEVRVHFSAGDGSVIATHGFKTLQEAQPMFDAWLNVLCALSADARFMSHGARGSIRPIIAEAGDRSNIPRGRWFWARRVALIGAGAFAAMYVLGVALNLSGHGAPSAQAQVAAGGQESPSPTSSGILASGPAPVWPAPTPAASGAVLAQAAGTRDALSAEDTKAVKAATSILANGKSSDPAYWVFAAPTCPSCQALDAQSTLASGWGEHVIPVGFTDQDKTEAAAVLCSQDPANAWHLAMVGAGAGLTKTCKAGLDAVEENDKLFVKLGFTGTPTLMTRTGRVGVGAVQAPVLEQWLSTYSK